MSLSFSICLTSFSISLALKLLTNFIYDVNQWTKSIFILFYFEFHFNPLKFSCIFDKYFIGIVISFLPAFKRPTIQFTFICAKTNSRLHTREHKKYGTFEFVLAMALFDTSASSPASKIANFFFVSFKLNVCKAPHTYKNPSSLRFLLVHDVYLNTTVSLSFSVTHSTIGMLQKLCDFF